MMIYIDGKLNLKEHGYAELDFSDEKFHHIAITCDCRLDIEEIWIKGEKIERRKRNHPIKK